MTMKVYVIHSSLEFYKENILVTDIPLFLSVQ